MALKVGDSAPEFATTSTDGSKLVLSEMLREHRVVLAFFPKAFTPG